MKRIERFQIIWISCCTNKEQTLSMQRFSEVLSDAASGRDVISDKIIDLQKEIIVSAKGVYIIDMKFNN